MNRHDVAMAGARSDLDKWHQIAQAAESERNQLRNDIAALQHQEQVRFTTRWSARECHDIACYRLYCA